MEETRKEEKIDALSLEVELGNYAFGTVKTAVVKCAIELGIAEAIENHGGPMTISELSSSLKCDPSLLQRIMRFLVHYGIFKQKPTSQGSIAFEQNPKSRRLIMRSGENSVAAFILINSSAAAVASFQSLSALTLANGSTSAFKMVHGKDPWSYFASDESYNKLFNAAMACTARIAVSAIIEGCPEVFDGVETLVDVGGGDGTALRMLVKAFPWIKGINFDLPHVVNASEKFQGIEYAAGDMFEGVPKANAIFIKRVMHACGDDECIRVLKNCREAIPKDNGKVIIVDIIIEEDESDDKLKSEKLIFDIVMMAHCNKGKERTLKEWDYILRQAGFETYNIKSLEALHSVIEAFPN